jgi:hypothetical protein
MRGFLIVCPKIVEGDRIKTVTKGAQMGKNLNPAGYFLAELLAHGFTYCLFQGFNFRSVIIGSLKTA